MLEYFRVFAKKIRPLPPEPKLSDFYHPSERQKNGELLFLTAGRGITTYTLDKYLKQMADEDKLYLAYYQPDLILDRWQGNKRAA